MSELLRKAIEIASQLNYMENEALRSVLHDINWNRKQAIESDIKSVIANQA